MDQAFAQGLVAGAVTGGVFAGAGAALDTLGSASATADDAAAFNPDEMGSTGSPSTDATSVDAASADSIGGRITGGFDEFVDGKEASGVGLGNLEGKPIRVTQKGLDIVKDHLSNPFFTKQGPNPENDAMIARLESAMTAGNRVTGGDASFYMHEVQEATFMRGAPYTRGAYDVAHYNALTKFGVSRFSVYHPDVIQSMPDLFGPGYKRFWGLT